MLLPNRPDSVKFAVIGDNGTVDDPYPYDLDGETPTAGAGDRIHGGGEDLLQPAADDLCFEMEGPATFGRIIKYDPASKAKLVPAVRMPGYTFQPGRGRFEAITKAILREEGVIAKDFYVKEMQELSHQGGFRQAPLWCMEFSYRQDPLVVSFKLPKGSYATTLLREIIKPEDPIRSGF